MKILRYSTWLFLILFLVACEEPFQPENLNQDPLLVVEGHIEPGVDGLPAYVILTKSRPFFAKLNASAFEELFVKDAIVKVHDGTKEVQLPLVCLSNLPVDLKERIEMELGIDPNSPLDYCIYVDLADQLDRVEGGAYSLEIEHEGKILSSQTSIPSFVGLDSIWFTDLPGEASDTLLRMMCTINDPEDEENFYRYFTGNANGPLVIPFQSVTDDLFFNGQSFDFPLTKAVNRQQSIDPNTFGFFKTGETVVVRWCTIDKPHFDFWNSLEFSLNNVGPFAAYTRVKTNVENGLGIWGGYNCKDYTVVVEK